MATQVMKDKEKEILEKDQIIKHLRSDKSKCVTQHQELQSMWEATKEGKDTKFLVVPRIITPEECLNACFRIGPYYSLFPKRTM